MEHTMMERIRNVKTQGYRCHRAFRTFSDRMLLFETDPELFQFVGVR